MSGTRTVTVTFEGEDHRGQGFVFERSIDATRGGDNPPFYGVQAAQAIDEAARWIRESVEAHYGSPPGGAP